MADIQPQINISSLDFTGIKNSFKEYLKTIPEFNDYNYEGSAINLLLDVFAYNTLYYAYYANMIANESFLETARIENNVSSLLKPLGVLLPSKSCSVGEITGTAVGTTSTFDSYQDYLIGTNSNGLTYRWYTIEDVDLDASSQTFKVYEAKVVANDLIVSVDLNDQKVFIANKDLDINTVRVKVNGEIWSLYDNNLIGTDAKVFFIDRTSSGFYVLFGKKTINDLANSYGKSIKAGDVVRLSYLIPTGAAANGVSSYGSSNTVSISSVRVSSGGKDSPDLDLYRYSAPKAFAANDRAVTKDDYYGLLLNSGLLPVGINTKDQINVWGGEEATPQSFGRVFISFADETLTAQNYSVKNSISYLKNKSIVTILPEYSQPQVITANIDLAVVGVSTYSTAIKNIVNNYYNTTLIFNNHIFLGDIQTAILEQYSVTGININSISLTLEAYGSVTDRNLYFKNEFATATSGSNYSVVKSGTITYGGSSVFLGDTPTVFDVSGNSVEGSLYLYDAATNTQTGNYVGKVDYKNGIVTIYANILPTTTKTKITVKPKYTDSLLFNNEFLLKVSTTVNGS